MVAFSRGQIRRARVLSRRSREPTLADQGVHIDFHFRGVGWADIHLRVHDKETTINGISYTTDALGDLLRAALMTATGAWTASASFDGEPYESRLVLLCGNWDSGK